MIPKPLDQITVQDITDLVANKVPEDKTLEYKEALPGPKDSERRESTADFTANRPLDRDILALPEVLIDEPAPDIPTVLRPIFDVLWQAGGWDHCHSYQADGTWRPQR